MVCNRLLTLCCAVALLGLSGCRTSQQSSIPNPFLTADKVPPVPTRIPAQGTAQPYYPSNAAPPLPPSGPLGTLAPSPYVTPIGVSRIPASTGRELTASVASAEPAMKIPQDNSSMRFASHAPIASANHGATALAPAQPNISAPITNNTVVNSAAAPRTTGTDASVAFVQPTLTSFTPAELAPVAEPFGQVDGGARSGLFREPRVRPQAPPLIQQSSSPRIRLPNANTRIEQQVVTPDTINTTSYQVGMAGAGQMQQSIIPPPGYVPHSLAEPARFDAPAISDGFRPRGTARRAAVQNPPASSVPRITVVPR